MGPPPGGAPTSGAPEVDISALIKETRDALAPLLVGLAAAFTVAITFTFLIVVGSAIAGDGVTPVGSEVDTTSLTVLFLPFQMVGMGLLGTISLSESSIGGSLYLPLYWVTAAFVGVTAFMARRSERRRPTSTAAQLRGAAIVGGLLGALLLPLMWLLALRQDGAAIHTASPSLFFGALLLTFAALWGGRWSATGTWHRAVPLDLVGAARVAWWVFLGWLAIATPVVLVITIFTEGFETALGLALFAPTVALSLLVLGHLGSFSLFGERAFAFDLDVQYAIPLLLAGVLSLLAASVLWNLRRTSPAGSSAISWVAMPGVGALSGLLLLLGGLIVAGGDFEGLGGSVTFGPDWWTFFLFAGWGLVVEVLSRSVAPALVGLVPRGVLGRIERTRPRHTGASVTTASPAPARTPQDKKRDRVILLAVGSVVAVVALLGIGFAVVSSVFFGPQEQAEAYLDAVSEGDLEEVVELAPFDFEPQVPVSYAVARIDAEGTDLFTSEVYQNAEKRITGYEIGEIEVNGNVAVVEVSLEGIDGETDTTLRLVKDGNRFGIFSDWAVADAGLASAVSTRTSIVESSDSFYINGITVEGLEDEEQWLLPGTYDVDPFADNPYFSSDSEPLEIGAEETYTSLPYSEATVSDQLLEEVATEVAAYLEECMQSEEPEPQGCPQSAFVSQDFRNLKWELTEEPTVEFNFTDGTFPLEGYISDGEAEATYQEDQSFGFGKPDFQPQTDTSPLFFSVVVDLDGDELEVTFDE